MGFLTARSGRQKSASSKNVHKRGDDCYLKGESKEHKTIQVLCNELHRGFSETMLRISMGPLTSKPVQKTVQASGSRTI